MIKQVFIDLDDTLWDTAYNNKESLHELYDEKGWGSYYGSFDAFYDLYAPNNEALWAKYRQGVIDKNQLTLQRFAPMLAPLGLETTEEILGINEDFLRRTSRKTKVINGALELLDNLAALYRVIVISNGFREVQLSKMESAGILPFVDEIILSEDAGINKPHLGIFTYAFSRTHARPSETIMIGDSWEADILGAQNARIASVWFNPLALPLPSLDHLTAPIYTVARLNEIPPLLTSLLPISLDSRD